MEQSLYQSMAYVEDAHWWFVARRKILGSIIRNLGLPPGARLLEVGCGTGGNLALLASFGTLAAMEVDPDARAFANARGVAPVKEGALPGVIPFSEEFDLIALFDVLEHVKEEEAGLKALHAKLKPNGKLVVTIPAFMFLWGPHDSAHHHYRRYTRPELTALLKKTGFTVDFISYFNFWLFPIITLVRMLQRMLPASADEAIRRIPPAPLNRWLTEIFSSEAWVLPRMRLPFGVSLIAVAVRV